MARSGRLSPTGAPYSTVSFIEMLGAMRAPPPSCLPADRRRLWREDGPHAAASYLCSSILESVLERETDSGSISSSSCIPIPTLITAACETGILS